MESEKELGGADLQESHPKLKEFSIKGEEVKFEDNSGADHGSQTIEVASKR